MKYLFYTLLLIALFACKEKSKEEAPIQLVNKNDLAMMKWIEGNWVGDYKGQPFYETYKMLNDTIFRIIGYEHVGTDTASFFEEFIYWENGAYYMGKDANYKIVRLTEKEVEMVPIKANNQILWSYVNDTTWTAILPGLSDTARYTLHKVSPAIDSVLLKITGPQ